MGFLSAPKAPDPMRTAQAQAGLNRETAITQQEMNMIGQNSPWGSVSYNQTGTSASGTPQYQQTTSLSPSQQRIFNQSQAAQGNLAEIGKQQTNFLQNYLRGGVNTQGVPALAGSAGQSNIDLQTRVGLIQNAGQQENLGLATSYAGADDFSADRRRVEDALWQRTAGDRSAGDADLRTTLANKGINEGSAAWNAEMARMGAQNTDARLATILAGGDEQARMVGMSRDAAMFGNDARLAQGTFGNAARLTNAGFANDARIAQGQFGNQARLAQGQFNNAANMTNASFQNAARGQGLAEAYQARNQPLNETLALMGGSQVQAPGQMMGATPQTGVGGVDYTGMVNSNYQQQVASHQGMMGGLGGLFGMAMGPQGFMR